MMKNKRYVYLGRLFAGENQHGDPNDSGLIVELPERVVSEHDVEVYCDYMYPQWDVLHYIENIKEFLNSDEKEYFFN